MFHTFELKWPKNPYIGSFPPIILVFSMNLFQIEGDSYIYLYVQCTSFCRTSDFVMKLPQHNRGFIFTLTSLNNTGRLADCNKVNVFYCSENRLRVTVTLAFDHPGSWPYTYYCGWFDSWLFDMCLPGDDQVQKQQILSSWLCFL